jgi:hypothetical protein
MMRLMSRQVALEGKVGGRMGGKWKERRRDMRL